MNVVLGKKISNWCELCRVLCAWLMWNAGVKDWLRSKVISVKMCEIWSRRRREEDRRWEGRTYRGGFPYRSGINSSAFKGDLEYQA